MTYNPENYAEQNGILDEFASHKYQTGAIIRQITTKSMRSFNPGNRPGTMQYFEYHNWFKYIVKRIYKEFLSDSVQCK